MSIAIASRPAEKRGSAPWDEGARVCDAQGRHLGFVESVDLKSGRFTVIEAGYLLGSLHGTYDLPLDRIASVHAGRVQLTPEATPLTARE